MRKVCALVVGVEQVKPPVVRSLPLVHEWWPHSHTLEVDTASMSEVIDRNCWLILHKHLIWGFKGKMRVLNWRLSLYEIRTLHI